MRGLIFGVLVFVFISSCANVKKFLLAHFLLSILILYFIPDSSRIAVELGIPLEYIPLYSSISHYENVLPFYPDFSLITCLLFILWMVIYVFIYQRFSTEADEPLNDMYFAICVAILLIVFVFQIDLDDIPFSSGRYSQYKSSIIAEERFLGPILFCIITTGLLALFLYVVRFMLDRFHNRPSKIIEIDWLLRIMLFCAINAVFLRSDVVSHL